MPMFKGGAAATGASRYALPPGTRTGEVEENSGGGGLFGLGFGPDIGFRAGDAISSIGGGLFALGAMAMPGKKAYEPGVGDFLRGMTSSLAGTAITAIKPATELADLLGAGDIESSLERGVGRLLGDEEKWAARDFTEVAKEDGLAMALLETVGNVSLIASAPTGAIRGAATAARVGKAAEAAAKLGAVHKGLLARPAIFAAQHPYRAAGRALQANVTKPARTRALAAAGIADEAVPQPRPTDVKAWEEMTGEKWEPKVLYRGEGSHAKPSPTPEQAGRSFTLDKEKAKRYIPDDDPEGRLLQATIADPWEWEPLRAADPDHILVDPKVAGRAALVPEATGAPVSRTTSILAEIENKLVGRQTTKAVQAAERQLEVDAKRAARSPSVRAAVRAAEDHLVGAVDDTGKKITRQQASAIIGEEKFSRMTGIKALIDEAQASGNPIPEDVLAKIGVRRNPIPKALRSSAELEAAIVKAVEQELVAGKERRAILESGRVGDKGLTDLGSDVANAPQPTRTQVRQLNHARRLIERAQSDALAKREAAQVSARERTIAVAKEKLGRIAVEQQRLVEEGQAALDEFDTSRVTSPKIWRAPGAVQETAAAIHAKTLEMVEANNGEFGGATFDPHSGVFIEPGDRAGYVVSLPPNTALVIPVSEFTPESIARVIQAYQPVYDFPNTTIGTWVSDGMVHIDPGEVVQGRTEALFRGALRDQEAVWDIMGNDVPDGILRKNPGVAAKFGKRTHWLFKRMDELREVVERSEHMDQTAADVVMDVQMRFAVTAVENGLVKHPDEFFRDHVKGFEWATEPSTEAGALRQLVLETSIATPESRAVFAKTLVEKIKDFDKTSQWYNRSNKFAVDMFGGQEFTLGDGRKIAGDDLFLQILAATSVKASPRDNMTRAVAVLHEFENLPAERLAPVGEAMKQWGEGKLTMEQALEQIVRAGLHEEGGKFAGSSKGGPIPGMMVDAARRFVTEILSGNTIDRWTPEFVAATSEAFGVKSGRPDRYRALRWLDENMPGHVDKLGEDKAVMEFYGREHRAKIMSFYDNLRDPENSVLVTLDSVMERLLGTKPTALGWWAENAENFRLLAEDLSNITGKKVTPNGAQALAWVYAKEEMARLERGHFNAFVLDTSTIIDEGIRLTDENDPMIAWLDEAAAPFDESVTDARVVQNRRILRDEVAPAGATPEPPERVARLYGDARGIEALFPEGSAGKTSAPWPNAGKHKFFADYRKSLITRHINEATPETLVDVDPRGLLSTQPSVTRAGVQAYLDNPERAWNGDTFADQGVKSNKYPVVYLRPRADGGVDQILLAGHHRATAALLEGRPLKALVIEGTYGPGRSGPVTKVAHPGRINEAMERVVIRPSWGASSVEAGRTKWAGRKVKWLLQRDKINAALDAGDVDGAQALFDKYVNNSRLHGFGVDTSGGDLLEIWNDPSYHTPKFLESMYQSSRVTEPGTFPDPEAFRQMISGKILGEFIPMDDGMRGVIRVFEDGNLATLVHENGHLLNFLLTKAEKAAVEQVYGIADGVWEVAHRERFADDFVAYMNKNKAPKGLGSSFQKLKRALSDGWEMFQGTFLGRRADPVLVDIFDKWLSPKGLEPPTGATPGLLTDLDTSGTRAQIAARRPKSMDTPAKAYASGRKGQKALAHSEQVIARQRSLAATKAKTEGLIEEVRNVLETGVPAAAERMDLFERAAGIEAKVARQLSTPSTRRTPARWQPLWDASKALLEEAADNPELAGLLETLPQTLEEVQTLALQRGFNPAHVRDFTPQQVRRLVWGNMRLGTNRGLLEMEAGTRKNRTGAVARAGTADRSVEAFLASTIEAVAEKRTNEVITWVEGTAARRIQGGEAIPQGWALWDPVRTFLLTGEEIGTDGRRAIASQGGLIVPEAVLRTVDKYTKDFDHWGFKAIRKATAPWRTLILTLSPGWYVRNFAGNVLMAQAEGVSLRDWTAAWKSFRTKDEFGRFADMPFVSGDSLAQEAMAAADDSIIPLKRGIKGVRQASEEGGKIRGGGQHVLRRMMRANEVVDEFARAAVYKKGRRMGMTDEQAWARAKHALVDYQALSPFERSAVRAVIPFYAWQKGILKVTMNQVIDHPARVAILSLLGRMQEEYTADRFGVDEQDIPGYYSGLVGDWNARSFNPFVDPAELLSAEGIARSINPYVEVAIRKGFGAPEYPSDNRRLGHFGSVEQDVDPIQELTGLLTGAPPARMLTEAPGAQTFGFRDVDENKLRERFLRARETLRGIPSPGSE